MSESGLETLPAVREWSGGPPGCPGAPTECPAVVERPSQMSRNGREALLDVQKWWEALTDIWEWSGGS